MMKTPRPWPNPKPPHFRRTPPEIVALDRRKRAAANEREERRSRFFRGVVNDFGISVLVAVAAAVAASVAWRP